MSDQTRLDQWSNRITGEEHWHLIITEADGIGWDRERLEMIQDAMFLVRQALIGNVEGPLTLPLTGLPIRGREESETP